MSRARRTGVGWLALASSAGLVAVCWFSWSGHGALRPTEHVGITFAGDVAPIVFAKCAPCHHPGEAAPFSLLTYDDVRRRSSQIVDVTTRRIMPPWLPRHDCGDFVGERRLTDSELDVLKEWAAAGTPRGNEADIPPGPAFADGWQTGPPDLVLETPAYQLSSQEKDVFRNFVVPVSLKEPKWVRSIELRPSNPRVTHHARLGIDSSNESARRDAEDGQPGYPGMAWGQDPDGQLVIWAPGVVASPGEAGVAWRLYPQSSMVLHTHMQPSGKPEVVRFRVGIRFAVRPPEQHPALLRIGSCDIDIPAGASRHTVNDVYVLPVDVDVHNIFPHAHSLCRELRVVAERPDGSTEPLIAIDQFDENWHDRYRYRQPVRLGRGTRLVSTFVYDNTDDNPRNRNRPARRTVYGSNAADEMADVYLQVTAVRPDQRAVLMEHYKKYDWQSQLAGHRRTLGVYPDNPWSKEGLAACYMGLGEPDRAAAVLAERLASGPKDVFPLVSLGLAILATGDAAPAEERLREAVAIDGEYALAWLGLGKALNAQKKPTEAEQAFRRAAELSPGLWEAWLGVADGLMQHDKLEEAREVCASAAKASPDIPNIYLKLAEISAKQQKWDESLRNCAEARRLAPYTHPPKVLLAVSCIANGDQGRGASFLREARAEWPYHPVPALMLGQLAGRTGQTDAARILLETALALPVPDNWPASHRQRFLVLLHSERLKLARQLGDVDLARESLRQWLAADPGNRQARQMFDELGGGPGR
jgi:tetratricopeptide (TPR) repeat protein